MADGWYELPSGQFTPEAVNHACRYKLVRHLQRDGVDRYRIAGRGFKRHSKLKKSVAQEDKDVVALLDFLKKCIEEANAYERRRTDAKNFKNLVAEREAVIEDDYRTRNE